MAQLTEAAKAVFESGIPAVLVSCAKDGTPNTTFLSRIYYVDEEHLAISYQFFSKTIRNVRENPRVALCIGDAVALQDWTFDLEYVRSETEGPLFDAMDMAIEAIASMTGMSGIFELQAADVYRVLAVERHSYE